MKTHSMTELIKVIKYNKLKLTESVTNDNDTILLTTFYKGRMPN